MKRQYYLLSALKQKSQHNNWISLTTTTTTATKKKTEENANRIERLEKQNHYFSESLKTCQSIQNDKIE